MKNVFLKQIELTHELERDTKVGHGRAKVKVEASTEYRGRVAIEASVHVSAEMSRTERGEIVRTCRLVDVDPRRTYRVSLDRIIVMWMEEVVRELVELRDWEFLAERGG